MESKIFEYEIILVHEHNVEQTEVIYKNVIYFCYSEISRTFGLNIHIFLIHIHTIYSILQHNCQTRVTRVRNERNN